jgi:NADPH-dependent glutamate synthase beta subunit-like oxidoreductase
LNDISDIPEHAAEVEKGFTEPMALTEASRCLQCGLVCYADHSTTK